MTLYALLPFLACAEPKPASGDTSSDTAATDSGAPADSADTGEDSAITYYEDIRPLMDRACARCHGEATQAFSFDDPMVVVGYAGLIASETAARRRPPVVADRTCASYENDAWYVTDDDIATFGAWAANGTPLGDPANAPAPWEASTIGPYDRELAMPQPHAPTTDNRFRCYELALGNSAPTYLRGAEVRAGDERIAHFAVVYLLPPGVTTRDGRSPQGYECAPLGEPGWQLVTGWMPGAPGLRFPEGSGLRLPADTRFVLQMHYRYTSFDAGTTDQSRVGLLLADSVEREVTRLEAGPGGFTIPAGAADHVERTRTAWSGPDAEVVAVSTRMNHLASGLEITAGDSAGTADPGCVARYHRYDAFSPYPLVLRTPVPVRTGDTLDVACHWDNSDTSPYQMYHPPQDAREGQERDSETCQVAMYIVPR